MLRRRLKFGDKAPPSPITFAYSGTTIASGNRHGHFQPRGRLRVFSFSKNFRSRDQVFRRSTLCQVEDILGLQERQLIRDLTEKTLPEREKEITEICGGTAQYEVDWNSLANDAEALRFLDNLSCHRLNMALRTIALDPMGKDALRDGLKVIKLQNVKTKEEMKIEFREGVLEMHCAYALRTDGMFNDSAIYKVLMEGL